MLTAQFHVLLRLRRNGALLLPIAILHSLNRDNVTCYQILTCFSSCSTIERTSLTASAVRTFCSFSNLEVVNCHGNTLVQVVLLPMSRPKQKVICQDQGKAEVQWHVA